MSNSEAFLNEEQLEIFALLLLLALSLPAEIIMMIDDDDDDGDYVEDDVEAMMVDIIKMTIC